MLKMFTTQLFGVLRTIQESEEEKIEDCARLLAQSVVGEGTIFLKGFDELAGIEQAILNSNEKFPSLAVLEEGTELAPEDCLLVFMTNAEGDAVTDVFKQAEATGVTAVTVGPSPETAVHNSNEFHIDTKMVKGLVPDEDGKRIGQPTFICALYVYYALYFLVSEMLSEYDAE